MDRTKFEKASELDFDIKEKQKILDSLRSNPEFLYHVKNSNIYSIFNMMTTEEKTTIFNLMKKTVESKLEKLKIQFEEL